MADGNAEIWDDPRITTFGMLLEAHAAVLRDVECDLARAAGMPIVWFEVLLRLARSPEGQLRMSELAHQVGLSTSGLTRLVDRLDAAGLVERRACAEDRRGSYTGLTAAGQEALRAGLPAHLETIQRRVVGPLGPDAERLTDLLRTLRDAPTAPGDAGG